MALIEDMNPVAGLPDYDQEQIEQMLRKYTHNRIVPMEEFKVKQLEKDKFLPRIRNLKVDDRFANYKKLCEFLGETPTSGRTKTLQLSKWQRYFVFDRDGQAFHIVKIYEEPKTPESLSKYYDSIYVSLLCILDTVCGEAPPGVRPEHDFCKLYINKYNLMQALGMFDELYQSRTNYLFEREKELGQLQTREERQDFYLREKERDNFENPLLLTAVGSKMRDADEMAEMAEMAEAEADGQDAELLQEKLHINCVEPPTFVEQEFFDYTRSYLSLLLNNTLKYLQNTKNLFYNIRMVIVDQDGNEHLATQKEIGEVLYYEGQALRDVGCRTEQQAFQKGCWGKYYALSQTYMRSAPVPIWNHYDVIELGLQCANVRENLALLKKDKNVFDVRVEAFCKLNETLVNTFLEVNKRESVKLLSKNKSEYASEEIYREMCTKNQLNFMEIFGKFGCNAEKEKIATAYREQRDKYVYNYIRVLQDTLQQTLAKSERLLKVPTELAAQE